MIFLSERNVEIHKSYFNNLILRYRIFEKSYKQIKNKSIRELVNLRLKHSEKAELIKLKAEIDAHKMYFSSFADTNRFNAAIRHQYGSEAQFFYDLTEYIKTLEYGFVFVYYENGIIKYGGGSDYAELIVKKDVRLSIDLCEHAYFTDYGFDRTEYIKNAVKMLDLSCL